MKIWKEGNLIKYFLVYSSLQINYASNYKSIYRS
jgi:hypothetical protein